MGIKSGVDQNNAHHDRDVHGAMAHALTNSLQEGWTMAFRSLSYLAEAECVDKLRLAGCACRRFLVHKTL